MKQEMGPKAFKIKYGPNTELKIRRKDGRVVTLDFRRPKLLRSPYKFHGAEYHHDPLAIKD
jgi:hypothetical protein